VSFSRARSTSAPEGWRLARQCNGSGATRRLRWTIGCTGLRIACSNCRGERQPDNRTVSSFAHRLRALAAAALLILLGGCPVSLAQQTAPAGSDEESLA